MKEDGRCTRYDDHVGWHRRRRAEPDRSVKDPWGFIDKDNRGEPGFHDAPDIRATRDSDLVERRLAKRLPGIRVAGIAADRHVGARRLADDGDFASGHE